MPVFEVKKEIKKDTEFVFNKQEEVKKIVWPTNVTAFINSVSGLGLLEIGFNASMQNNLNLSLFNESMFEMYIVPAIGREKIDGFNLSTLNFTFKAVKFT